MKYVWRICALAMFTSMLWAQSTPGTGTAPAAPGTGMPPARPSTGVPGRLPMAPGQAHRPNILFIIMDDVGIDQMTVFGYGGDDPANTPNINAIAHAGVRFRNVWSMPECSPSRAVFFEGRYPLRTNVLSALLSDDLANSQVSPFEYTTPKLLQTRNYESADFGKFHLASTQNNPFGNDIVHALGWDYFDGSLDGAPHPIDETAGGVSTTGGYTCGFVPNAASGGADAGACRFAGNTCQPLTATTAHPTPGRYCMEQGGIFVPNATCQQPPPSTIDFNLANGYYVWPRVINFPDGRVETVPLSDPRSRGFIGEAVTTSAAAWINAGKNTNKNWMVTVAYPQIHTPYQQVPENLLATGSADLSNLDCTGNKFDSISNYHLLSNQMLESMDTEVGRLLVQTGLATYNSDGSLNYQPEKTNTMLVIAGDNGTYSAGVKTPFDPNEAKATVYQTGVWVPLIISGPLVNSPDRNVESLVNIADLFQLFGELAGIDVHKAVPASHILDSRGMLAYLINPNQASIRQTDFTQIGNNIHTAPPAPCVIQVTTPPSCIQLFTPESLCVDEGGLWYGPGATPQFTSCCALSNAGLPQYANGNLTILPDAENAIRNDAYKLIQKKQPDCSQPPDSQGIFPDTTLMEFYQINEAAPTPQIDRPNEALCADTLTSSGVTQNCPATLTPLQTTNFTNLLNSMTQLLGSEPPCPGDGNEDKVVDQKDVNFWKVFAALGGSSWYDFNFDGKTDNADLAIIQANLGKRCLPNP